MDAHFSHHVVGWKKYTYPQK